MIEYKRGSTGDEVKEIQTKLVDNGFYNGPLDGIFGGGTEAAVKAFQKKKRLKGDGIVGSKTWKKLFQEDIPEPEIITEPLDYRVVALTGSFETGKGLPECFTGISGDFDGQGVSFGVLQWNFGQDSLQPMLKEIARRSPDVMKGVLHEHYPVALKAMSADKDELMGFVRSIQHPVKHYLYEPWKGIFKSLGRTKECQKVQVKHAGILYRAAKKYCEDYGLWSERALALMFDIKVQNGSISSLVKAQIKAEFSGLPNDLSKEDLEVCKMQIIANRRAEASNPRWVEDVRARKLCIANGGGVVHGINFDLDGQFGIGLREFS
jgi:peptidoglycan hydrolase-like protein with peptidoglycan-binding domain